jgi:tetratricopeptide (TPR) repeat protein
MRTVLAPFVLVYLLLYGAAASADQQDPRLDGLFARLQSTSNEAEAARIEAKIWHIWLQTGQEDLNVLMRQGARAMSANNFALALESFNALIRLAPNLAEAWNKRATLYYLMRKFDASIADVKQTLALEPRHFGAVAGLGLIFEQLGNLPAALQAFRDTQRHR